MREANEWSELLQVLGDGISGVDEDWDLGLHDNRLGPQQLLAIHIGVDQHLI
jgi:hypothetical protein